MIAGLACLGARANGLGVYEAGQDARRVNRPRQDGADRASMDGFTACLRSSILSLPNTFVNVGGGGPTVPWGARSRRKTMPDSTPLARSPFNTIVAILGGSGPGPLFGIVSLASMGGR